MTNVLNARHKSTIVTLNRKTTEPCCADSKSKAKKWQSCKLWPLCQ